MEEPLIMIMPIIEKRGRGESGFSFVEIMLSIALIGVISTALFAGLQSLSARVIDLQMRTQGLTLAKSGLEKVLYYREKNGFNWLKPKNFPEENDADGVAGFKRSYKFEMLSQRLKKVIATVQWKKGSEKLTLWVRDTG